MVDCACLKRLNHSLIPLIVIEENGVRLRLNIVDTPGYGDQVNNDRWYTKTVVIAMISDANFIIAGTQSSSISRISIRPTFEKNSPLNANDISKTLEYTVAFSSSNLRAMRK